MRPRRSAAVLPGVVLLVATACSPSSVPASASAPATSSASDAAEAGGLPPGCEPIDLRDPTGERIVLDGTWVQDIPTDPDPMTWWVRTAGDCVWGAGTVDEVPVDDDMFAVQALHGRVRDDFVIEGEITSVGPPDPIFLNPFYAPVRLLIEFDEQGILLREERAPAAFNPRCPLAPNYFCPSPLVLRPAAD